jgi:hypothetical protein
VLALHLAAKDGKLPYEEEAEWSRAADRTAPPKPGAAKRCLQATS